MGSSGWIDEHLESLERPRRQVGGSGLSWLSALIGVV
jgi:hypothetical protein